MKNLIRRHKIQLDLATLLASSTMRMRSTSVVFVISTLAQIAHLSNCILLHIIL